MVCRAQWRFRPLPGAVVLGHQPEPARVLVEPVHDPGTGHPRASIPVGEDAEETGRQQPVHEGAVRVTRAGWTTSPAGFSTTARCSSSKTMSRAHFGVGARARSAGERRLDLDDGAGFQPVAGPTGAPADTHASLEDPGAGMTARETTASAR
jgi:hypothetical protein